MLILIDSREKLPLEFKIIGNVSKVEVIGLPFGDYTAMLEDGTQVPICFDRKTLEDLYSTLTSGIDRFKREIEKSKRCNFLLYLIIEGTLSDIENGNGATYSSIEPQSLIKTIFTLMVKYDINPIFCKNREEMVRFMIYCFEAFGRNFKREQAKIK